MRRLADYTVGLAIVITHLIVMAAREWRLRVDEAEQRSLPRGL
jgi:hypothetical protein